MFFGSQKAFKSVTAAECLALGSWKVMDSGRVGLIFNDSEIKEFKAQRSRKALTAMLHETAKMNQSLGVEKGIKENPNMLNSDLVVIENAGHNRLYVIISDFQVSTKNYSKVQIEST